MNGHARILRKDLRRYGLAAGGLAAVTLAGCADVRRSLTPAPVNVESPVAAQVQSASTRSYVLPRLTDVPPPPKNVPPAAYVKVDVIGMVRCRRAVDSFPLSHPPLSGGAAQFAANERGLADMDPADIPPANQAQLSDAAAVELRAYAAPPPALASGPPPTPAEAQPPAPVAGGGRPTPHARPAPVRHAHPASVAAAAAKPVTSSPSSVAPPASSAAVAAQAPPPLPPPLSDPYLGRCT